MAGKRLRCGLVMVMSPFLMFLDFRNGFDVFVDGVCCMYEKERRCTGPVESQCHGAYTQQNLPVSVPDVVTWAVFISKSCSSAGADGDVCPSWGWLLLLAVAGVFHSILFIVFVAFSSGNVTHALFLAYSLQWFSLCLFPAMVQFVFVSRLQPAMVQFVFVSRLQPAMVQFVFVSRLQPAMVQFVFVSWVSGRLGVLVYIEVWLFNIQKFELSKILFKEVSYSHRVWNVNVNCMHQGSESNAISFLCMYVLYMWKNWQ